MKVELRKADISPDVKTETIRFRADLYVDGEMVAEVENDGFGGAHRYSWEQGREGRERVERIARVWAEAQGGEVWEPLEQLIDALVLENDYVRRAKWAKRRGLVTVLMEKNGAPLIAGIHSMEWAGHVAEQHGAQSWRVIEPDAVPFVEVAA